MPTSPVSTSPDDWDALKDLVADALDQPEAQREAFLQRNATNPSVVAEARKLLTAQTKAGGVLHRSTDRFLGLSGPDTAALEGRNFDKYKLVRLLGEGGMAAVYLAHQVGVERPVALKILRPSALGYDAARRFAQEVAAHGRIEHPHIARIYDAGVWKDPDLPGAAGVPYIAMEFVDGEPLNVFAKEKDLSLPDQLRLLADVADAVHAAHQRAIVHRDLKPGNILVADDAKHGSPTVLDFGIARVLQNADETGDGNTLAKRARALQTTTGVLLGTLAYMAPEQARGDTELVDVRSDVYALGIMLHELVTGRLPVAVTGLPLARALQQLADPNITAGSIGPIDHDQTGGDLRTVLTTALAAEPDQRYASAEALADDLRRMLRHEPIEARPPTRTYVIKKFVRRNRGAVVSAALLAAALTGGTVFSTVGFVRERVAKRDAEIALAAAEISRQRAETSRQFVMNMIDAGATASSAGSIDVTVADALRLVEPDLPAYVGDDPVLEADLRQALAEAYSAYGDYDSFREQAELALAALQKVQPEDHNPSAEVSLAYALVQVAAVRGRHNDARQAWDEAESQWTDRLARMATSNQRTAAERERLEAKAGLLSSEGDPAAAAQAYDELLAASADVVPGFTANATDPFALMQEDHLTNQMNAAISYLYADRAADAEALLRKVADESVELRGPTHVETLRAKNNLCGALIQLGKLDEAEAVLRQALIDAEPLDDAHEMPRRLRNSLVNVLIDRDDSGGMPEAIALIKADLQLLRDTNAATFDLVLALNSLGNVLHTQEQYTEAADAFGEAVALMLTEVPADHPHVLTLRGNLASVQSDLGDAAGAAATHREILQGELESLGERHPNTIASRSNLGLALMKLEQHAEAIEQLSTALRLSEEETLAGMVPQIRRNLGTALLAAGRVDEAERQLRRALPESEAISEGAARRTASVLVELLESAGRQDEADVLRDQYGKDE